MDEHKNTKDSLPQRIESKLALETNPAPEISQSIAEKIDELQLSGIDATEPQAIVLENKYNEGTITEDEIKQLKDAWFMENMEISKIKKKRELSENEAIRDKALGYFIYRHGIQAEIKISEAYEAARIEIKKSKWIDSRDNKDKLTIDESDKLLSIALLATNKISREQISEYINLRRNHASLSPDQLKRYKILEAVSYTGISEKEAGIFVDAMDKFFNFSDQPGDIEIIDQFYNRGPEFALHVIGQKNSLTSKLQKKAIEALLKSGELFDQIIEDQITAKATGEILSKKPEEIRPEEIQECKNSFYWMKIQNDHELKKAFLNCLTEKEAKRYKVLELLGYTESGYQDVKQFIELAEMAKKEKLSADQIKEIKSLLQNSTFALSARSDYPEIFRQFNNLKTV